MYPYLHPPFDNRSRLPPSPSSSSSPPSPPSTSYPDIAQGASRPGHMDYHTPALSPIYEGHYPSQTAHSHNTHRRTGSDPLTLPLAYGRPYPDVHRRSGPRTSTARCEWEGCDITSTISRTPVSVGIFALTTLFLAARWCAVPGADLVEASQCSSRTFRSTSRNVISSRWRKSVLTAITSSHGRTRSNGTRMLAALLLLGPRQTHTCRSAHFPRPAIEEGANGQSFLPF